MREKTKVHLALALVSFMFGISYVLTKLILHDVPPRVWSLYRVLIATVSLLPFLVTSRVVQQAWRNPRIWIAGLFGVSLNQLLFAEGLKRTTPSHSSLINACIPAMTLVLSVAFGREKWSWRHGFGILCAVAGVAVLIGQPVSGANLEHVLLGDLLTVGNITSFSLFLVIGQSLAREYSAFGLTAVYFLEGIFILGIYAAVTGSLADDFGVWRTAPLMTHLLMLFVAISSSTVTYTLNNWTLKRAEPSEVATYITLQPVIAALMSALVFGEHLKAAFIPSFVLVAIGVFLSSTGREHH